MRSLQIHESSDSVIDRLVTLGTAGSHGSGATLVTFPTWELDLLLVHFGDPSLARESESDAGKEELRR